MSGRDGRCKGGKSPEGPKRAFGYLSRRQFIAAAAAVPFVPSALAQAAVDDVDRDAGLLFILSEDEKSLIVRRIKPATKVVGQQDEPALIYNDWVIESSAFGPHAWFDFDRDQLTTDLAKARSLVIRDVEYGNLTWKGALWLKFNFTKDDSGPWMVGADANVMVLDRGKVGLLTSENVVALHAFIEKQLLKFKVKNVTLGRTLGKITGGRIAESETAGLELSATFQWNATGVFRSTDKAFEAKAMSFGWLRPPKAAALSQALFYWKGTGGSFTPLEIGDGKLTPKLTLSCGSNSNVDLFCVRTSTPVGEPSESLSLFLKSDFAMVEIDVPGGERVGKTPLRGLTLATSTVAAAKPLARRVAWADVAKNDNEQDFDVATPIGRMTLTRLLADNARKKEEESVPPVGLLGSALDKLRAYEEIAKLTNAGNIALGDRSGLKDHTFYVLADDTKLIRRASFDVALKSLDVALPDVSHSALTFEKGHLRLFYTDGAQVPGLLMEQPVTSAASYLWLGPPEQREALAVIDLMRAALDVRRDSDLVDLKFRFADLALVFDVTGVVIRPRDQECRVIEAENGERRDNRPIMSVEFGPQHVMEEAFFQPEPPPLPDVVIPDFEAELRGLALEKDPKVRVGARTAIRKKKLERDKAPSPDDYEVSFTDFAKEFEKAASAFPATRALPEDQRIYIGPFAMDPDAMRLARTIQAGFLLDPLGRLLDGLLGKVAEDFFVGNAVQQDTEQELEEAFEKAVPLYGLWRATWREVAITLGFYTKSEYVSEHNPQKSRTNDAALLKQARDQMLQKLMGLEPIEGLAEARLSGRSRLAFRINCMPGPGDHPEVNQLPEITKAGNASGGTSFAELPFTFEALTDWSHHEPAVTRRAQKLYDATQSGLLPPVAERAANLDDRAVLEFQGIGKGEKGTADRMAEVRASLAVEPTAFETSIEIPSRLILSTAQDAVWQANRRDLHPECKQEPRALHPLWTARLLTAEAFPSVRVVASPDFRGSALTSRPNAEPTDVQLSERAPPRGPYAPWLLSRAEGLDTKDCPKEEDGADSKDHNKKTFFKWLCRLVGISRDQNEALYKLKKFRSSLDAYDRHELVLLSSAYGLPVTGKREQKGDNPELGGAIKENAGQFEPGEDYTLYDGTPDQAIYRPKPLDVEELSLTALGGSLVHDTSFVPPLTAFDYQGQAVFDGMSIERWQHRIVLGRDIVATVVYSGYLFPLGHKATLVKVTERVFINVPGEGIKAPLRQRMFVRVSNPEKIYPAVGQPNAGRQWCSTNVVMLTRQTPDIVDPTYDLSAFGVGSPPPEKAKAGLNGRIQLGGHTGLAFWPQTALDENSRVKFEFLLDGRPTSMPLIFVDRVANRPDPLSSVFKHYGGAPKSFRTMNLGGQSIKFAEPVEDGDTNFAAEQVVVVAQGRRSTAISATETWEGNNLEFSTTGVLEGADQPPFYPVMDYARIRIEQVEQLSGKGMEPVAVRFDGHYVRHGFIKPGLVNDENNEAAKNAAEVLLYVDIDADKDQVDNRNFPALGMGQSGNQSGGVAQPNLDIVALSRAKGPLGANTTETGGPTIYCAGPGTGPTLKGEGLQSVALYFAMGTSLPVPGQAGAPLQADPVTTQTTFQSFFNTEAKLLGVISFGDLMKLLRLVGATNAIPVLQEVVEYGFGAAQDAQDFLKQNVLIQLKQALSFTREQWAKANERSKSTVLDALQNAVKAAVNGKQDPPSLQKLFPEVDAGLGELELHVNAALAEEDPIRFANHLSKLFSAGKRFIRLLTALASNAPERVRAEIAGQMISVVKNLKDSYEAFVRLVPVVTEDAKAQIIDVIVDVVVDEAVEWLLASGLPWNELQAVMELAATTAEDKALLNDIVDKTRPGLEETSLLSTLLNAPLKDATFDRYIKPVLLSVLDQGTAQARDALRLVVDNKTASGDFKIQLTALLTAYSAELKTLRTEVDVWQPLSGRPETARVMAAVARFKAFHTAVRTIIDAKDWKERLQAIADLARDHFGLNVESHKSTFSEAVLAWLKRQVNAIDTTLAPIPDAVATACLNYPLFDKEEAADAIVNALPGHWLEDAAKGAQQSFKVQNEDLKAARDSLVKAKESAPQPARDTLEKAINAITKLGDAIAKSRQSLCVFIMATYSLQQLKNKSDAGNLTFEGAVHIATQTLRDEERAIDKMVLLLKGTVEDLLAEPEILGFTGLIAAISQFIELEVLKEELEKKRGTIEKAEAALAENIALSWNSVVSIVQNAGISEGGTAVSTVLDELNKKLASPVFSILNPERSIVSTDLTTAVGALDGLGFGKFAPLPNNLNMKDLLDQKVVGETKLSELARVEWEAAIGLDKLRDAMKPLPADAKALLARIEGVPATLANRLFAGLATSAAKALVEAQTEITALRKNIYKAVPQSLPALQNALLVQPIATNTYGVDDDKFHEELAQLKAIRDLKGHEDIRPVMAAYTTAVADDRLAVLQVLEKISIILNDVARGEFLSLVDIGALRDEVEDRIAELLPVKRKFNYDLGFDFDGDNIAKYTGDIFVPESSGRFDLKMNAAYDLLKGTVDMKSVGSLGPFDVKLVGKFFDAVTLQFDGMDFSFELGGSTRFDVHYRDFVIGSKLQFVQKLQSFLNPSGDGNGFFMQAMQRAPGIEAGYGLNLGTIQLGGMAFSNVSLNVIAELPFDGSEALFKFSLGRATAPFLVSIPPFGGGAYVAIFANAQGFRGVEAAIEFGGVADFSTGPLIAVGRISAGFYVSSLKLTKNGRDFSITQIGGTFYAGGAASIWIFSFHASLYVRLTMKTGGQMEGIAIFSFSFNMGITDYKYRVSFQRKQKAIGNEGGGNPQQGALEPQDGEIFTASTSEFSLDARPTSTGPRNAARDTKCQTEDLREFLNYFDMELVA